MGGIERFGLPKQGGVPASQAVKADGWLFVAGQVPKNAEGEFVVGGIAEQARQTLDNLMAKGIINDAELFVENIPAKYLTGKNKILERIREQKAEMQQMQQMQQAQQALMPEEMIQ